MPFVRSPDGLRLKYEIEGDGPTVLLHLGAGCDSGLWRQAGYVEGLADSYRCVLFDHRGHGKSDRPRGAQAHEIDRYVADVLALLDELQLENVAFWGYSAGISVGVKLADEYSSRIWALIGSGALGPPPPPEEFAANVARRVAEQREYGWEKMLDRFDEQEPEPVPDWMKERIRATDIGQFNDYLEAAITWDWEEWDVLPRISVPTLFFTGELEDPDDHTAEAVERMPNGARVRIPRCGHINAYLRSDIALTQATAFFAKYAPKLVEKTA